MLKLINKYLILRKNFKKLDVICILYGLYKIKNKIFLPKLNHNIFIRNSTKDLETFNEIFIHEVYKIENHIIPNTIIDAGANTGFASLYFKLNFPKSEIVTIEIEKNNVLTMKENLRKFEKVYILENALSNKIEFYKIKDNFNATNSFSILLGKENDYDVKSITIDEIVKTYNWETIDYLKIDIEGAEKELFSSNYENWLPKCKVILIETHDRMVKGTSKKVFDAIDNFNFILYTTKENVLVFYNLDYIKLNISGIEKNK